MGLHREKAKEKGNQEVKSPQKVRKVVQARGKAEEDETMIYKIK